MSKIFYSWQSDLDKRTNRNFIHRCLSEAAKQINSQPQVEDAPREQIEVDQDTQGIPGHPEISQVIFDKIKSCSVFVPDFSLVALTSAGKKCPNPNVMIEYGYALHSIGSERILPIMNTAYGDFNELPFDLRHRRAPLNFHLSEIDNQETIKIQKETLTKKLTAALNSNLLKAPQEKTQPLKSIDIYSKYIAPIDHKTTMSRQKLNGENIQVNGLFIVIIPSGSWARNNLDFRNAVAEGLQPLGDWQSSKLQRWPNNSIEVYESVKGYPAFAQSKDSSEDTRKSFTQCNEDGVIIAFDRLNVHLTSEQLQQNYACNGIISTSYIEKHLIQSIKNCLAFYKNNTTYNEPFTILVGLHNITGFRVALPAGYRSKSSEEKVLDSSLYTLIKDVQYSIDIKTNLKPFINDIWDSVLIQPPTAA